jgi:hypothetical protein
MKKIFFFFFLNNTLNYFYFLYLFWTKIIIRQNFNLFQFLIASIIIDEPPPPPLQIPAIPNYFPFDLNTFIKAPIILAPLIPSGCPTAIAPPFKLI